MTRPITPSDTPMTDRTFRLGVAVVASIAWVARVLFAVVRTWGDGVAGDAESFQEYATNLVNGRGYSGTFLGVPALPTAQHPPAFPLLIAGMKLVGLGALDLQRLVVSTLGVVGVVLIAFVGRRLSGPTLGLVAASIAAVHPMWVQPSGILMSEATHLVLVPAVLLMALRYVDHPSIGRVAAAGAVVGVAALNRSEALLLWLACVVAAIAAAKVSRRAAWRHAAVSALAMVVVVAPWVIRNVVVVDARSFSTNNGVTLLGANCGGTYARGSLFASYSVLCAYGATAALVHGAPPPDGAEKWTLAAWDREMASAAIDFARSNATHLPAVATVRVLRMWGFWAPAQEAEHGIGEGRDPVLERVGFGVHYILLVLALLGATTLPAPRRRWWPVFGPLVAVSLVAVVMYGSARLRVAAEPSIALLAAAGVMALASLVRTRRPKPAQD